MKDSLVFDTTDANTIADSDSVGAYIRSSDGTRITHTNDAVNSKDRLDVLSVLADEAGNAVNVSSGALDVNVTNSLGIDVDLDHTEDSVRLGDGTNFLTSTTVGPDIGLDVNIINASVSIDDGGGAITVDAVDLDIRDLSAAQDSVQSNLFDGAGTALTSTLVGADQALDVNVVSAVGADPSLANVAIANASNDLDVANTAEDVVAAPLADRKYLYIYNNGNRRVFVGASGVSSADGFPLSPRSVLELRAGAAIDIEWVGPNTNQNIRTLELS